MTQRWCEGTGLVASAECNQVTVPGSCQLERDRHLNQVLPGAPGAWLYLTLLGGLKVPKDIEERALGWKGVSTQQHRGRDWSCLMSSSRSHTWGLDTQAI